VTDDLQLVSLRRLEIPKLVGPLIACKSDGLLPVSRMRSFDAVFRGASFQPHVVLEEP
jgi:hypothetical protein